MGEPILISELAENMVRLAGLSVRSDDNPDGDIEIISVGKRIGEKMLEELSMTKLWQRTRHPKIMRTTTQDMPDLEQEIIGLEEALMRSDEQTARHILFDIITKSDIRFLEKEADASRS